MRRKISGYFGFVFTLLLLLSFQTAAVRAQGAGPYRFGIGKGDITGEAAEIGMAGYAQLSQKTSGIHMRQWARAFIIEDRATKKRVVYVNNDLGMVTQGVRQGVLNKLKVKYGNLYVEENVMLTATHTHAGPAGYAHETLLDIPPLGFQEKTYNAIVDGIVRSITRAHEKMQSGRLYYGTGKLTNASANRALIPFGMNKLSDADKQYYKGGIDPQMTILKFVNDKGALKGVISWFPVHATSMSSFNTLISPDNKGYAQYHWEHDVNTDPEFVAAFAQTNAGDVSPNLKILETEPGKPTAPADPKDEFNNTKKIGLLQFQTAYNITMGKETAAEKETPLQEVKGALDTRFKYVNFQALRGTPDEPLVENGPVEPNLACEASLGLAFTSGSTEDNPSEDFVESIKPLIPLLGIALGTLSPAVKKCHAEKQIVIDMGNKKPYSWSSTILPVQMFRIGQVALLGGPGEFTVMSGVRIRREVQSVLKSAGIQHVILNGYANSYVHYITTRDEYTKQEYEGASTIFGPWEQKIFQNIYVDMAARMRTGLPVFGEAAPDVMSQVQLLNLQTPVLFDNTPTGPWLTQLKFGHVLKQPEATYKPGQTVEVEFVTGHPKNDLHTEGTFLRVFYVEPGGNVADAVEVANDNDWETKYRWVRTSELLPVVFSATSKAQISWDIPLDAKPGDYVITHYGDWKSAFGGTITSFSGTTRKFKVVSSN